MLPSSLNSLLHSFTIHTLFFSFHVNQKLIVIQVSQLTTRFVNQPKAYMKKIVFSLIVLFSAFIVNAQPPEGDANPGEWYGAKVDPDGMVDIAKIPAQLEKNATFDTKVKAKILDVCPKKGCWLKLQVNDSTTALVKMKDYAFFLQSFRIRQNVH